MKFETKRQAIDVITNGKNNNVMLENFFSKLKANELRELARRIHITGYGRQTKQELANTLANSQHLQELAKILDQELETGTNIICDNEEQRAKRATLKQDLAKSETAEERAALLEVLDAAQLKIFAENEFITVNKRLGKKNLIAEIVKTITARFNDIDAGSNIFVRGFAGLPTKLDTPLIDARKKYLENFYSLIRDNDYEHTHERSSQKDLETYMKVLAYYVGKLHKPTDPFDVDMYIHPIKWCFHTGRWSWYQEILLLKIDPKEIAEILYAKKGVEEFAKRAIEDLFYNTQSAKEIAQPEESETTEPETVNETEQPATANEKKTETDFISLYVEMLEDINDFDEIIAAFKLMTDKEFDLFARRECIDIHNPVCNHPRETQQEIAAKELITRFELISHGKLFIKYGNTYSHQEFYTLEKSSDDYFLNGGIVTPLMEAQYNKLGHNDFVMKAKIMYCGCTLRPILISQGIITAKMPMDFAGMIETLKSIGELTQENKNDLAPDFVRTIEYVQKNYPDKPEPPTPDNDSSKKNNTDNETATEPEQTTAPAAIETETGTENNENITNAQSVEDSITDATAPEILTITKELAQNAKSIIENSYFSWKNNPHKAYTVRAITNERIKIAQEIEQSARKWKYAEDKNNYCAYVYQYLMRGLKIGEVKNIARELLCEFKREINKSELACVLTLEIDCINKNISYIPEVKAIAAFSKLPKFLQSCIPLAVYEYKPQQDNATEFDEVYYADIHDDNSHPEQDIPEQHESEESAEVLQPVALAQQPEKITLQDPEYLQLTTSATENQRICNKKRRENSKLINACKTAEEITELVCTLKYCTAIYIQMDYDRISPCRRPHVKDNTDVRPLAEFFAREIMKRRERKATVATQPVARKTDKDSQVMQDIIRDIDALTPEQINTDASSLERFCEDLAAVLAGKKKQEVITFANEHNISLRSLKKNASAKAIAEYVAKKLFLMKSIAAKQATAPAVNMPCSTPNSPVVERSRPAPSVSIPTHIIGQQIALVLEGENYMFDFGREAA